MAAFLPLRGRKLRQVKLPLWGMVIAHFGIAVALGLVTGILPALQAVRLRTADALRRM